ncbi:cytotoxic and regulatory T-cell molecule isoform X2 [Periophthalmus magnuspinnatus]|uniref:cytotoxic and regulatory T-cell molecule isoform X2 n=1 Tax=Periophthalmus magnuspinnatus TaxID=409849 RepID=UPI0024368500|nr:cytotoxic and regulatory T-cell molecule isoform X2 [Periophthalmus magnuspinnatus]
MSLCSSEMEKKLQLCVLMLQLQVSLAVWQHISVMKGHTLNLNCPLKSQFPDHAVEWRNTDGVKDKRYRLHKLSESEFRISISKVTFSDGGIYTCSHYLPQAESKRVNVTVIGKPRIERTTHEGWTVIRCTAEANYSPPNLSWKFKNGLEFLHDETQIHMVPLEKKYVSIQTIYVKPAEKTFAVKCIMRHPAWHSWIPLMDFVNIRPNKRKGHPKTTTFPERTPAPVTAREPTSDHFPTTTQNEILTTVFSTIPPQFSTGNSLPTTEEKAAEASTAEKQDLTSEISRNTPQSSTDAVETTELPMNTSQINSTEEASTVNSTTERSGTLNTSGNWLTVNISSTETTRNSTGVDYDVEKREGKDSNTSLLVFLITCLMVGLLVVVIFIGIKLRKAHIIWKRENEETVSSEVSSKSKSSQEEKNTRRRRGLFNTGLTQYVIQEPTVITSVTNPAAMTPPETTTSEHNSAAPVPPPAPPLKSPVKETEL